MDQLQKILSGLSDLHGALIGNQAACEQVVELRTLARQVLESEDVPAVRVGPADIAAGYRSDVVGQLARFKELLERASATPSDSELFILSSAAQLFSMAVHDYFNKRDVAGVPGVGKVRRCGSGMS